MNNKGKGFEKKVRVACCSDCPQTCSSEKPMTLQKFIKFLRKERDWSKSGKYCSSCRKKRKLSKMGRSHIPVPNKVWPAWYGRRQPAFA